MRLTTLVSWTFLAYFVILFAERLQSIVRIAVSGKGLVSSGFEAYVNILTIISLLATSVMLVFFNSGFWRSLSGKTDGLNITMLCITAGVLLLGGMVHTEFTIPGIQFASYGILILGLILQTVISVKAGGHAFPLWYSLIYLVAFSMAIPVMYHSSIEHAVLFHILEALTAFVMVALFTLLMLRLMTGSGENLLLWVPFLVMLVLDTILIAMRWKESVNTFVLIFASLSTVLFIAGKIIFAITAAKK